MLIGQRDDQSLHRKCVLQRVSQKEPAPYRVSLTESGSDRVSPTESESYRVSPTVSESYRGGVKRNQNPAESEPDRVSPTQGEFYRECVFECKRGRLCLPISHQINLCQRARQGVCVCVRARARQAAVACGPPRLTGLGRQKA